jgi:hypothetical protein
MSTAMTKVRGMLFAASASAALMLVASAAEAGCRTTVDDDGETSQFCSYGTFGMTPQQTRAIQDDDDEDDDDVDVAAADDDEDDDEDTARGFTYDEDQGSVLVDLEDCAPGKFWMMETDEADDVMLPCR